MRPVIFVPPLAAPRIVAIADSVLKPTRRVKNMSNIIHVSMQTHRGLKLKRGSGA
jgi:hypothetical protein